MEFKITTDAVAMCGSTNDYVQGRKRYFLDGVEVTRDLYEREARAIENKIMHDALDAEDAANRARDAVICQRCGQPRSAHVVVADDEGRCVARLCPTSTFQAHGKASVK